MNDSATGIRERRGRGSPRLTSDCYLELLDHGAIVVSKRANALRANQRALQIIARRDLLVIAGRRIIVLHTSSAQRVLQYVKRCAPDTEALTLAIPGVLTRTPYVVQVRPHADQRSSGDALHSLMAIYEPTARLPLSVQVLRNAYGLTQAEARAVRELACADDLPGVAERLGVTFNTVRAQVKQVFRKLGVTSQAQLMRLLASGPRR